MVEMTNKALGQGQKPTVNAEDDRYYKSTNRPTDGQRVIETQASDKILGRKVGLSGECCFPCTIFGHFYS